MHITMPRGFWVVAVIAAAALSSTTVWAAGPTGDESRAAFERLKGLVGVWDVTEKDNPALKEVVTYSTTIDRAAVESKSIGANELSSRCAVIERAVQSGANCHSSCSDAPRAMTRLRGIGPTSVMPASVS